MKPRYILIIALALLSFLSLGLFIVSKYVQPLLYPEINSDLILAVAAILGAATFLSALRDIIELVERFGGEGKKPHIDISDGKHQQIEKSESPLYFLQSLETFLDKDWVGDSEPFRLHPVPKWIDYQDGLIPSSSSVDKLVEKLNNERFVYLIGPMGSGKSTTAYQVGFILATEFNWAVSVITDIKGFAPLCETDATWLTLRELDKENSLIIFDDVHLIDRKIIGRFIMRSRQETSRSKFLFVGRATHEESSRRRETASELSLLPKVECLVSHELISTIVRIRCNQLNMLPNTLDENIVEELYNRCGGDLFVLISLLQNWEGGDIPELDSVIERYQAVLMNLLVDESVGVDGILAIFTVACLFEIEIETPVELLTGDFLIPWQVINNLIEQQEVVEAGSQLALNHASQAYLVRKAILSSARLRSSISSRLTDTISDINLLDAHLIPLLVYMRRDPKISPQICFQFTKDEGREREWLQLWNQPSIERIIEDAFRTEAWYFHMGWILYSVGDVIHELNPPDAEQQYQRLGDFVRSVKPTLASRLKIASADEVIDFLMMPMIWSTLIDPLVEILEEVGVEDHEKKLVQVSDSGTIGLYLNYIFSSPVGAALGSKLVTKIFDHLLNVIAGSSDIEGVGRIIYSVGHMDANSAFELLNSAQVELKEEIGSFIIQLIHDDDQWDDIQALRASSLIFGKGGTPRQFMRIMEHLVELEPEDVWVRTMYGRSLAQSGRFAEAEREFRTALSIQEDYELALESLSAVLSDQRKH